MNAATFPSFPSEVSPLREAGIVWRRICLLRLRGAEEEAAFLQSTELSGIVETVRQATPAGADCDAQLNALFAREEARVVDAGILAEVLLPLLREQRDVGERLVIRSELAPATPANRRTPSGAPPGIADFIDEMIQQERTTTHPAP